MNYISYCRVSTKLQGLSHLGLDAQKASVLNYVKNNGNKLIDSFVEVESGKNDQRPVLLQAINRCKETGSLLLIAKIDRLSRNIAFIFTLKEELQKAGVDFVALDLPFANTLMLGVMASMAQHEREIISQRTRAGLQAAKARGQILGKPENLTDAGRLKGHETIARNARTLKAIRFAWHYIKPLRDAGTTYQQIADMLNEQGYKTARGYNYHPVQVWNICKRFEDNQEAKQHCTIP